MPTKPLTTAPDPDDATTSIGLKVSRSLKDQIEAIARREHNGISAVCRRLLAQALDTSHSDDAA